MLHSGAKWIINETSEIASAQNIAEALSVNPHIARLLVQRGIDTVERASAFLGRQGNGEMLDPMLLRGMETAVRRIRQAVEAGEKIRIYGDYDADGVSSTALASLLFAKLGADFDTYIPHRVHEGYGLNAAAIDLAKRKGITLIVTVDNGISAVEQIRYASELGIDVVVTDHHEPPERLPDAYAIVNPKQPGCAYPYPHLAGVGVVLKLAQALLGEVSGEMTQLAALGTIADVMPLTGENRTIVKLGLEHIRQSPLPGIKALLGTAGVDYREANSSHVGFSLGPRINASGRLDSASASLHALLTVQEQEAEHAAFELDRLNKERQRIVESMHKEAAAQVESRYPDGQLPPFLIVSGEDWNPGVIGIVASKLVEAWCRPCIVFSVDPNTGLAKGSARSIDGFDLHKALSACQHLLEHFGGHQAAAGMTLKSERLAELEQALGGLASEWLSASDFVPKLAADMLIPSEEISLEFVEELRQLEPFGAGNPSPRFVFEQMAIDSVRAIGKESQHLKLSLLGGEDDNVGKIDGIAFGKGKLGARISSSAKLDLLAELEINEWNGRRKPQLMVQDLRIAHRQVFDWRGCKPNDPRVAEWFDEAGPEDAVLVFDHPLADTAHLRGIETGGIPVVRLRELSPEAAAASLLGRKRLLIANRPLTLGGLRLAIAASADAEAWYAWFGPVPDRQHRAPNRDHFKRFYAELKTAGTWASADDGLLQALSRKTGHPARLITAMMDVFEELGFIEREGDDMRCVAAPVKRDLNESRLYAAMQENAEVDDLITYGDTRTFASWMQQLAEQTKTLDKMEEAI